MPDTKVASLTAFTDPLYTDIQPIVDLATTITKKVTVSDLLKAQNYIVVVAPSNGNKKGANYVCPGSADQTTINSAITDCNANGGGIVYLRQGTYSTTNVIIPKSNVYVVGENMWTTKIANTGIIGASIIASNGTSAGAPITNIGFINLMLDGTSMNNGGTYAPGVKGIYITYIRRGIFQNLYIYNTYASGLGIDFLDGVFIDHVYAESCGRGITDPTTQEGGSGIGIGTGGFTDEPTEITNCISKNNGKYGIFLEGQSSTPGNYYIVSNNLVTGNYHGLGARSTLRGIFSGNQSYANTLQGMLIDDSPFSALLNTDIQVVNNKFRSNGDYGLKITDGHVNIQVTGNQFITNTTGPISAAVSSSLYIGENSGIGPVDKQIVMQMKNTSGGSLAAGDLVIIKSVAAGNEVDTTTSAGNNKVFGMATETITNNSFGNVQTLGKTTLLKVDGTNDIAIGDYLTCFTTAKIAAKAAAGNTVFAIALEVYTGNDSNGVIDALLISPQLI